MNSPPLSVSRPTKGNVGVITSAHRLEHPFVCPVTDRDVLSPAGKHVRGGQCPGEFPGQGGAAVDDHVRFNEPPAPVRVRPRPCGP